MHNPLQIPDFDNLCEQVGIGNKPFYTAALFAQYQLETGNGSSNLYKQHSNLFAMRPAQVREKFYQYIAPSAEGEMAGYEERIYSLQDRLDLDKYMSNPIPNDLPSTFEYMEAVVENGYATDPDYLQKWSAVIASSFPNYAPEVASWEVPEIKGSPLLYGLGLGAILILLIKPLRKRLFGLFRK